jgi:hypothetical protein
MKLTCLGRGGSIALDTQQPQSLEGTKFDAEQLWIQRYIWALAHDVKRFQYQLSTWKVWDDQQDK